MSPPKKRSASGSTTAEDDKRGDVCGSEFGTKTKPTIATPRTPSASRNAATIVDPAQKLINNPKHTKEQESKLRGPTLQLTRRIVHENGRGLHLLVVHKPLCRKNSVIAQNRLGVQLDLAVFPRRQLRRHLAKVAACGTQHHREQARARDGLWNRQVSPCPCPCPGIPDACRTHGVANTRNVGVQASDEHRLDQVDVVLVLVGVLKGRCIAPDKANVLQQRDKLAPHAVCDGRQQRRAYSVEEWDSTVPHNHRRPVAIPYQSS